MDVRNVHIHSYQHAVRPLDLGERDVTKTCESPLEDGADLVLHAQVNEFGRMEEKGSLHDTVCDEVEHAKTAIILAVKFQQVLQILLGILRWATGTSKLQLNKQIKGLRSHIFQKNWGIVIFPFQAFRPEANE